MKCDKGKLFYIQYVVKDVTKDVYNDADLVNNIVGQVDGIHPDTIYYKLGLSDDALKHGFEDNPIWLSSDELENWLNDVNYSYLEKAIW